MCPCRSHTVQEDEGVPDDRGAAPRARIPEAEPGRRRQGHHLQPAGEKGRHRP